jgi:hypothetical protein
MAAFSALNLDRQYGPTASLSEISTFSSMMPVELDRVRMLSVLVCRTRWAPASIADSRTLTVP